MHSENQGSRLRRWGLVPYQETWLAMQRFTDERTSDTPDEIWWLEHPPVYTVGRNGRGRPSRDDVPLVLTDRGGDITYHGPGQVILYVLVDLHRLGIGVRELVDRLEAATIDTLGEWGIAAQRRPGAPGVYVQAAKIAALGLRIRRGCSYHGLALNVAMDLQPFSSITPCGLEGIDVVQVADFVPAANHEAVGASLVKTLQRQLYGNPS